MKKGLMNKLRSRKGQGLVEYALIIALIAVVALAALNLLGDNTAEKLNDVATEIGNAAPAT